MAPTVVGIDVFKDRLDVAIRPAGEAAGEAFAVSRDAEGLDVLASLAPCPRQSGRWKGESRIGRGRGTAQPTAADLPAASHRRRARRLKAAAAAVSGAQRQP